VVIPFVDARLRDSPGNENQDDFDDFTTSNNIFTDRIETIKSRHRYLFLYRGILAFND